MALPQLLTLVFAAFLLAGLAVRFWLSTRQMRHVAAHRDAVPPPFAQTISLAAHQRAADYTIARGRFGLLETAFETAVLLGWTLLGGLDALNQSLLALLGPGMAQQLALFGAFMVIGTLLEIPFSLYSTFVIEQRFGFNKMSLGLWLGDLVKNLLLSLALGLPLLWVVLWLMGAAGTLWWLYAWGVLVAYMVFMMWLAPAVILPLFNKFSPLQDEQLRERIAGLLRRCGFVAKGLFVMDGSKRSAHVNAFFTGLGSNKRVVLFDTLLAKLNHDETEAVLAHELGHFKHRHVQKRMAAMFALSLPLLALLGWLTTQAWFYQGLGVRPNMEGPNDALALLLFMLALPVFSYFVSPIAAQLSRRDEFQADAFAVAQASGKDLASALLKLYEDNASTLTPDPVFVKFYYSHPPATERLARLQGAAA
jgi:STE24 endopeptidase